MADKVTIQLETKADVRGPGFTGPNAGLANLAASATDSDVLKAKLTTIKATLRASFDKLIGAEKKLAALYVETVRAIIACFTSSLKRREIVEMLVGTSDDPGPLWNERTTNRTKYPSGEVISETGNPGRLARHFKVAAWETGKYGDSEVEPKDGVLFPDGIKYATPLAALATGLFTWSQLYETWRSAVEQPLDLTAWSDDKRKAGESFAGKVKVTVRIPGKPDAEDEQARRDRKEPVLVVGDRPLMLGMLYGLLRKGQETVAKMPVRNRKELAALLGIVGDVVEPEE